MSKMDSFAVWYTGGSPEGYPAGQKIVLYGVTAPEELTLEEFADAYERFLERERQKSGVVVNYFDGVSEDWEYSLIVANKVVASGYVQRGVGRPGEEVEVYAFASNAEDRKDYREVYKHMRFEDYYCGSGIEGHHERIITELFGQIRPDIKVESFIKI